MSKPQKRRFREAETADYKMRLSFQGPANSPANSKAISSDWENRKQWYEKQRDGWQLIEVCCGDRAHKMTVVTLGCLCNALCVLTVFSFTDGLTTQLINFWLTLLSFGCAISLVTSGCPCFFPQTVKETSILTWTYRIFRRGGKGKGREKGGEKKRLRKKGERKERKKEETEKEKNGKTSSLPPEIWLRWVDTIWVWTTGKNQAPKQ